MTGKKFESVGKEFLWKWNREEKQPFIFTEVGREWGKMPRTADDKNQYEIDLCALNKRTKEILFGECKWQENVDAFRILQELRQKAAYVPWHNQQRKEYYALFAKSFKDKNIKEKNIYLFDLKYMEKEFKKKP